LICQLLEYKSLLIKANCIAAELDCLCSLALVAHESHYCCPVVTEDNDLVILEGKTHPSPLLIPSPGRHPLTEVVVDGFIPNGTKLSSREGNIQLITGKI